MSSHSYQNNNNYRGRGGARGGRRRRDDWQQYEASHGYHQYHGRDRRAQDDWSMRSERQSYEELRERSPIRPSSRQRTPPRREEERDSFHSIHRSPIRRQGNEQNRERSFEEPLQLQLNELKHKLEESKKENNVVQEKMEACQVEKNALRFSSTQNSISLEALKLHTAEVERRLLASQSECHQLRMKVRSLEKTDMKKPVKRSVLTVSKPSAVMPNPTMTFAKSVPRNPKMVIPSTNLAKPVDPYSFFNFKPLKSEMSDPEPDIMQPPQPTTRQPSLVDYNSELSKKRKVLSESLQFAPDFNKRERSNPNLMTLNGDLSDDEGKEFDEDREFMNLMYSPDKENPHASKK